MGTMERGERYGLGRGHVDIGVDDRGRVDVDRGSNIIVCVARELLVLRTVSSLWQHPQQQQHYSNYNQNADQQLQS